MENLVHPETAEGLVEGPPQSLALQSAIAGTAHDLNNVVAAILIYSGLLLRQVPYDSPLRAQLEQVNVAAERGRGLVAVLLRMARGESKRTWFGSTEVR
jgi:signal transduction histidine kinase